MKSESKKKEPQKIPWLIPQPHGGALNSGGTPGNKGGRYPLKRVREIARDAYCERIPRLVEIIDDPASKPSEVVAAMALLERTGVGQQHHVEVEQPNVTLNLEELREQLLARHARIRALPPVDESPAD